MIGSLALVLLTQLVLPAVFALVHARRNGRQAPATPALARASLRAGLRAFLGLVAFVLPGVWLQARYSFAGIYAAADDPLRASTIATRRAIWPLTVLVVTALFASLIGQSLVAVLNESLGVIEQASVDGRMVFQLHYLPHAVTSVVAYLWSAATVTFQAIAVSETFDEVEIPAERRHGHRQVTGTGIPQQRPGPSHPGRRSHRPGLRCGGAGVQGSAALLTSARHNLSSELPIAPVSDEFARPSAEEWLLHRG